MSKILIICGPTATGKTSFALEVAKKINGELVSADSRQVYTGMDIVTGKDIPLSLIKRGDKGVSSNLLWHNRYLIYYLINGIRIWLYDVVNPDEEFNVSFWKECADLVIANIHKRGKLPIVVGGTGLYLKSLTQFLSQISIPPNPKLRAELAGKNPEYLFNYLHQLNPLTSAHINQSDRFNPRRLIRAIEIAKASSKVTKSKSNNEAMKQFNNLTICLTSSKDYLYSRINQRVDDRVSQGAIQEAKNLLAKYSPNLPSMTSSGYRAFSDPDPINKWKILEHQYARRQLTWFKKQPDIHWFDIADLNWTKLALDQISNWYNKTNAQKD
jgi:tRNA dimethylallyltransferase